MQQPIPYRRILLKLSGESLMGSQKFGIDQQACQRIALAIKTLQMHQVQVALVIGAGNIFRGIQARALGIDRTPSDQMGMLGTLINGVCFEQALKSQGCPARVLSALHCPQVAESYTWRAAMEYLEKGEVLIFAGGTGHPYFTTDTAAALRASEIKADLLIKATKVDGIYDKDPFKHADAKKYDTLTYEQVLAQKLEVMDATSIALCMSSKVPVFVFNMQNFNQHAIVDTLLQQKGTIVR